MLNVDLWLTTVQVVDRKTAGVCTRSYRVPARQLPRDFRGELVDRRGSQCNLRYYDLGGHFVLTRGNGSYHWKATVLAGHDRDFEYYAHNPEQHGQREPVQYQLQPGGPRVLAGGADPFLRHPGSAGRGDPAGRGFGGGRGGVILLVRRVRWLIGCGRGHGASYGCRTPEGERRKARRL